MAQYPAPQYPQPILPPPNQAYCSLCNTMVIPSVDAYGEFCPNWQQPQHQGNQRQGLYKLQQGSQTQPVFIFPPGAPQPVFNNITVTVPPQTPPVQTSSKQKSPISVSITISAGVIILLLMLLRGTTPTSSNSTSYNSQSSSIQPTNSYYYSSFDEPTNWNIPVSDGQGVIIADGVTGQDAQYGNLPIEYRLRYEPGNYSYPLTHGYIEYVSPTADAYSEYCRHLQLAVAHGINITLPADC